MKKTLALILAFVMIMSASVFAAEIGTEDMKGAKQITGATITYEGGTKGAYSGNTPDLVDGKRSSFGTKLKGTIQMVFSAEQKFSGVRVWMSTNCVSGAEGKNSDPNMNGKDHRRAETLLVKISNDGKTWTDVAVTRSANNQFWFDDYYFGKEVTAKYLSLSSQKSNDGWGEWEIGEIAFITDEAAAKTVSNKQGTPAASTPAASTPAASAPAAGTAITTATATQSVGEKMDRAGISVKASSDGQGGSSQKMLDGNINSYWHSAYTASGSTITSYDKAPFTLDFALPKKVELSGISYIPRQDSTGGYWKKIRIYYSADGKKYQEACTAILNYTGKDSSEKIFGFGKNVQAKAIRIIIEESSNYCMAAEVNFHKGIELAKAQPFVFVKTTTTADVTPGSGKIVLKLGSATANANGTAGSVTAPYIIGGATMLPFKYTVEALGGTYTESGDDITATYNGIAYNFKKNSNYLAANNTRILLAKPTTTAADGTAMVPVIFFSKVLGINCEWNQAEQTIVIKK